MGRHRFIWSREKWLTIRIKASSSIMHKHDGNHLEFVKILHDQSICLPFRYSRNGKNVRFFHGTVIYPIFIIFLFCFFFHRNFHQCKFSFFCISKSCRRHTYRTMIIALVVLLFVVGVSFRYIRQLVIFSKGII